MTLFPPDFATHVTEKHSIKKLILPRSCRRKKLEPLLTFESQMSSQHSKI